jgi:hypothetical protein
MSHQPSSGGYYQPYSGSFGNTYPGQSSQTPTWYYDYYELWIPSGAAQPGSGRTNTSDWYSQDQPNRYPSQRGGFERYWTDQSERGRGNYEERGQEYGFGSGMQQVRGEILRTKRVEVRGAPTDFLAVLLQDRNGRQLVVDIGSIDNLRERDIRLHSGDQIWVRGRFVRLGDFRVLMADELRADGQTVEINRQHMPSAQRLREEARLRGQYGSLGEESEPGRYDSDRTTGQEMRPQIQQVRGQIMATNRIELPGVRQARQLVLLKTERGRQFLVDLGFADQLQGIELNKGASISVTGPVIRVGHRSLLLAHQVRAQGETFPIGQRTPEVRSRLQQIEGEVARVSEVQLPGMGIEVIFALLKGNEGQPFLVCLGPTAEMEGLEVKQGDEISVRGQAIQIDGQTLVLAHQFSDHGQTVHLDH